jgi:cell division transport system permease protein
MTPYARRAVKDIFKNVYLNAVAVITISLSVLIISAFGLFVLNANDIVNAWKDGIRIMAYLKPGVSGEKLLDMETGIREMKGVKTVDFISRDAAMEFLKEKMKGQASLLGNLEENPLPDAFEISLIPELRDSQEIDTLAKTIGSLPKVDEVEYGQVWLKRFINIFNIFRFAAVGIGGLFFMASVFIIGNTIRLVLYSRREEIEIMRFVGATDRFIKIPFYLEGIILGATGGGIGIVASYIGYAVVSSNMVQGISSGFFHIRFFPPEMTLEIFLCSILVGWLGCYLSLKQFLKQ